MIISHDVLCYFLYYYFLYSTLCQIKKLLLKELKKIQSQNTKQVEYCELFETGRFGGERLKFFQKQGDYSHSRVDGEN